jgi:hypothetical protein
MLPDIEAKDDFTTTAQRGFEPLSASKTPSNESLHTIALSLHQWDNFSVHNLRAFR